MVDEKYIREFSEEITLPKEAAKAVIDTLYILKENEEAYNELCALTESYEKDSFEPGYGFHKVLEHIDSVSDVNFMSLQLLFLISLTPHLRELYDRYGYGYDRFIDAAKDLKWKAFECKQVYGVWGSFVCSWQIGIFRLAIFAVGRLQFELNKFGYDYACGEMKVSKGDDALFVHIPSSGRLDRTECLASYAAAEKFFRKFFPDRFGTKPIIFKTTSWLLYPANKIILPKDSNIVTFMNDYDVFSSADNNINLWRIFYRMDYNDNPEEMPADTSLQRAYINWLKEGNKVGEGTGVFIYKNGEFLR